MRMGGRFVASPLAPSTYHLRLGSREPERSDGGALTVAQTGAPPIANALPTEGGNWSGLVRASRSPFFAELASLDAP